MQQVCKCINISKVLFIQFFFEKSNLFVVSHLSRYLWTRLCVEGSNAATSGTSTTSGEDEGSNDFELYVGSGEKTSTGSYQLLDANYTLEQINERYWRLNTPIELYYHQINRDLGEHSFRRGTVEQNGSETSSTNT